MSDDAGDADRPAGEPAHPSRSGRRRPWPRIVTALAGLALLVAGVVTVLVSDVTSYSGSYDPLPESTEVAVAYSSVLTAEWLLPDRGVLIGLLLAVAGAAVLLVTLGWWIADLSRPPTARVATVPSGRAPTRSRWMRAATAAVGPVLAVIGVVVHVSTPPPTFGWFAYAPLSDTAYVPSTAAPAQVVGSVLVVAGIALTTFTFGWWVGDRRRISR